jgi:hypothetical protein
MTDPPDDLADLLAPQPAGPSRALRDAVLLQTERRLARDRWVRRGTRAVVVAGVFAAGSLAGWFARPERERVIEVTGEIHSVIVPVPVPVPDRFPSVPEHPPLSASAAELQAEQQDNPNAAATLYRQAGDAFLRERDYSNATRCYRLYLARGGDAALSLDSNDSWLLVSLKNAAYKEKVDVTKNDS